MIDAATGRGVPLIELRTPDGASYLTDSQGVVAFDDLSAMGRPLRFEVSGDGYRLRDPSGAVELEPSEGGHAVIAVDRLDIAERLYRVTGAGIYRDSVRLGLPVPIRRPLVNADVAGQDSVQTTLYQGRVFWLWGDTPSLAHPLWNFHTTGATSKLPADGGLDPALGVDLDYFVDRHGNVRAMAPIPGPGATWLSGARERSRRARRRDALRVLRQAHAARSSGRERALPASIARRRPSSASSCSTTRQPIHPDRHGERRERRRRRVRPLRRRRADSRARRELRRPRELAGLHAVSRGRRSARTRARRRAALRVASRRAAGGRGGPARGPHRAGRAAQRPRARHRERRLRRRPRRRRPRRTTSAAASCASSRSSTERPPSSARSGTRRATRRWVPGTSRARS